MKRNEADWFRYIVDLSPAAYHTNHCPCPGSCGARGVAYCGRTYERSEEHRARAGEPGDEVGKFTAPLATTRSLLVVGGAAAHVGDDVQRVDDAAKLTGGAMYASDLVFAGMLRL